MKLGSRRVRLKGAWLLVIPYLVLASPTPAHLAAGGFLVLVGSAIRSWAAGCIRKNENLATRGPYAHLRNPLYLGSFFLGTGIAVAGGRWIFVLLFLLFFFLVYRATMRGEEEILEEEFGEEYRRYRQRVPALIPRLTPYRQASGSSESSTTAETSRGFSLRSYLRNREWEATLGVTAGFAFLVLKMFWTG